MGILKGFKNMFVGEELDDEEFERMYDPNYQNNRREDISGTNDNSNNSNNSQYARPSFSTTTNNFGGGQERNTQNVRSQGGGTRMNYEQSHQLQIVLARPTDYSEVRSIGDDINAKKTVILNLEEVKSDEARRILDFLTGVGYANQAQCKLLSQKTWCILACNVGFDGKDLMEELENNGLGF